MKTIAALFATALLLVLAVPALAGGNHPPCPETAGLAATYQTCVTPTPTPTPTPEATPTPQPTPTPTPQSNCRNDGTDRPGTCSQPTPTPTPVATPTPATTPTPTPDPTPDATPELPVVPTLPPTDTGTADPVSEPPPLYLWFIGGLAVLFLVATPSRRRFVNHAHWVGRDQAHKR